MFLFSPKFDWSLSHLSKFNWSCCTLPKCSYFTQMFVILPQTWLKFFSCPNSMKAVGITTWFQFTQGQCLFYHHDQKRKSKKRTFWLLFYRWFGYYFALVWKIDTTSLTCECSCILCPNMANFSALGNATASPASPCRTLMRTSVATSPVALRWLCDSPRTGCAWRITPLYT